MTGIVSEKLSTTQASCIHSVTAVFVSKHIFVLYICSGGWPHYHQETPQEAKEVLD